MEASKVTQRREVRSYKIRAKIYAKAQTKARKGKTTVSNIVEIALSEYSGVSPACPFSVGNLCERLKKDADFFYSWQSNIAMSFYDVFNNEGALCDRETHKERVLESCNNAAKNFLNILIR